MLEARTWIPAWLGSAGLLGYAVRRVRQTLSDGKIVMMAILAALIFALQMLNFPVAGGTSGHFAGGALAAIVLGLWPGMLVMAAVLVVQALFFGDGGITTMGANFLNMAIIGPAVGWAIHGGLTRLSESRKVRLVASALAGWCACVVGALSAALMLWLSGRAPLSTVLLAMGGWHAIIGIGEAVITTGIVGYLLAVRPDLLTDSAGPAEGATSHKTAWVLGGVAVVAAMLSYLASSRPDGLEFVYEGLGAALDETLLVSGIMPDYVIPGVANEVLAGVLAGIVGVIITGTLAYALFSVTRDRHHRSVGD